MNLQAPLALSEGVFLLPVTELPEDIRTKLAPEEGDFALTRPQGRSGSKIVDRDTAELLERFREPRTIVEAVVLFSRFRGENPEQVLDGAFPLLKGLVASGFLVPAGEGAAPPAGFLGARWQVGEELLGGTVIEVLQVLEDTELYAVRRAGQEPRVIKIERSREGGPASPVRAQLMAEAGALLALEGSLAPRLYVCGELDGRSYLELEFVAGCELERERERSSRADRATILELARRLVEAYAELHARGVLHGDVHPRNVLIERSGEVRLIDFGFAEVARHEAPNRGRGGIAFYYEPELARASLAGAPAPPSTPAGEQYAVAVMLYQLATGSYPRDYSLGREEMLREIAELPPLSFAERGAAPWPELEAVLARALAKEPAARFASLSEFAAALAAITAPEASPAAAPGDDLVRRSLAAADLGGAWEAMPELPAPRASINYGAAGVALGLLTLAQARGEGRPLATAGHWLRRAGRDLGSDEGFYNPKIDITPEMVGRTSPYHSPAGLHAVDALLARAKGDLGTQASATAAFIAASEGGHNGLDLTLGTSATLLGAAILLDALPRELAAEERALRELGGRLLREIWSELDGKGEIRAGEIEYLGIAHGWAGFLYAALTWCEVSGDAIPVGCAGRLQELAALARPRGRGLVWPWSLSGDASGAFMPGWCNGSCGYVFLWTLAHRLDGAPLYLELARGAAWDAVDAPDGALTLCCGIAGRGYALLNLFRATGEGVWVERTAELVARAAAGGSQKLEHPHSLWKGELGLAVLAADLARPEEARMPLFEVLGYRSCS